MSSMLEQAILDAKELKEAAIKNAQQSIIEKYSNEFEGEIEKLLEQAAPIIGDAAASAPAAAMPAMPGMTTPGAAPVDPEKAKSDSDSKSSMFDNLNYAFKDGEVIENKIFPTGVVEVDLDSLSEFSFENNKKTPEQMALQELKNLSLREQIEEEMNDDDDYDSDSDSFPYEDSEDDDNEEESEEGEEPDDEEFEDEESEEDLEDEESDMDVDIEDEEFTDDEDMEDEDLYGTEDDVGFHVDYDTDEEDEESEEDYNPDADVEDFEDEESEEDMEDEEEDSEEDEEDEEYYYDDEEEDSEEDEEDSEDEEDEELEENEKKTSEEKAVKVVEDLIKQIENALNVLDTDKHPGLEQRLKRMLKTAQGKKEELQEAIKLDWKRSGQRSPFTGMFKEEAEHDYMLEQVQAQIQALQQEVEELQESNKKQEVV